MRWLSIIVVLAIFLSGCASKTPTAVEVRAAPARTHAFSVSQPYDEAYGLTLAKAKACYEEKGVGLSINVVGTMYPEPRHAEVSEQVVTAFGPDTTFVVDIREDAPGSQVTVYDMSRHLDHGRIVESWLKDGSDRCK
jgi:hypothetical protein